MLKVNKILFAALICSSVIAVSTMTGCRTASIPVEVAVPGEFNLSGISKIAIVDFNSVPGDPVAGVYAADKDTMSIVQRMVATTFCKGKMYQIANLDIEKEIAAKHTTKLANRFDGVMYGRVWWQISPEYRYGYPKQFTLETWKNVKYNTETDPNKKPIYATARVTLNKKDVLETLYYRAWNANLMLSLTLYRINKDGQFEKLTETYAVASQNFIVDNGVFDTKFVQIGADKASRGDRLKAATEEKSVEKKSVEKKSVEEKSVEEKSVEKKSVEEKSVEEKSVWDSVCEGAGSAWDSVCKGAGSAWDSVCERAGSVFGKKKVDNGEEKKKVDNGEEKKKVDNGKEKKEAIPTELQAKIMLVGKLSTQLSNKLTPSKITFNVSCDFDDDKLFNLLKNGAFKATKEYVSFKLNSVLDKKIADEILGWTVYDEKNKLTDEVAEAVEEYKEYVFAMAISCEALGEYEESLAAYRYLFNIVPEKETALGISRCLFALGMNDRVKEKAKAQKAASKKASLK